MTVQDTSTVGAVAGLELAPTRSEGASARPIRRLPVQKDWSTWALLAAQIGILVGGIAIWEVGATAGWIDAFFWSQPSAIARTLTIFFTTGEALTGAIVGEFIASQHGLGRAILYAGQTYDIALVWVAVLVLSTLAVIMYATVSWLESVLRKGVRQ